MSILAGFVIAVIIALTGVGAGVITAPLLIVFLQVPPEAAVGTALAYSAAIKLIVAPVQMARRQVDYKVLGLMLLGGLPGVVLGSIFFQGVARRGSFVALYWILGGVIILSSSWHIFGYFRPEIRGRMQKDRLRWLAALMLPVGAEVGFSSSGAGALGTAALLSLTSLPITQVIGTDLAFGLGITLVGSGVHILGGSYNVALLLRMIVGGIAGAIVGSGIAPRVPGRQLRFALSLFLFALGVEICCRAARF